MTPEEQKAQLEAALQHRLGRLSERERALKQAAAKTKNMTALQVAGTLLKTYAHQIQGRPNTVTLPDYRQENAEMVISLDPGLTIMANAEAYFHRYRKAKRGHDTVLARLTEVQTEKTQRQAQLSAIQTMSPAELDALSSVLHSEGVLKQPHHQRTVTPAHPRRFYTTGHVLVEVGKNDRQNDTLTLTAPKTDYWLHVRDLPGSHVVLHTSHPSEQDITEAAILAAYYSKGRGNRHVPVDLLKVSQMQKPKGAKPGLVTFSGTAKTVTVTPTREFVTAHLAQGEQLGEA